MARLTFLLVAGAAAALSCGGCPRESASPTPEGEPKAVGPGVAQAEPIRSTEGAEGQHENSRGEDHSSHLAASPTSSPEATRGKAPELPNGVLPGITEEMEVPGDRDIRVVHAGPEQRRAIVYLHGMCGNPHAMDGWSPLASHYGTMVVLRADVPCQGRPGYRWPDDPAKIQARIDRALEIVREQRGGLLETDQLMLIGYSQGAHRGELLAAAEPERYPLLILGGPPTTAIPDNLRQARAVAVLGGELENTDHMRAGDDALRAAGIRSKFFVLPRSGHGGYGPEGTRVMGEVFRWVFADDSPASP